MNISRGHSPHCKKPNLFIHTLIGRRWQAMPEPLLIGCSGGHGLCKYHAEATQADVLALVAAQPEPPCCPDCRWAPCIGNNAVHESDNCPGSHDSSTCEQCQSEAYR